MRNERAAETAKTYCRKYKLPENAALELTKLLDDFTNSCEIAIQIEDGLIQDIHSDRPLRARVFNYDVENADEADLSHDPNGNWCIETCWEISWHYDQSSSTT